ncbi:MAG: hypothetical protein IT380_12935 [Myxococcales bacterium]|nr:hypothetical protein [Myxococcales bacterium]
MDFVGDPDGITALKALYARDKSYAKFLIGEARSNTDFTARFTAEDGKKWAVVFDPKTGNLTLKPDGAPAA